MFNRVLRSVSSTVVSLVILFEIPGAALLAWVWLDQSLQWLAVPAIALLLGGLALVVGSKSPGTAAVDPGRVTRAVGDRRADESARRRRSAR